MNSEKYSCPLCDWTHVEPCVEIDNRALADVFGFGVMSAVGANQRSQRIEDALAAHFRTHQTREWLKKVTDQAHQIKLLQASLAIEAP